MSIESFRGPGGARLYYRYDDFTDPWKDSPTIVLAHGFGGFAERWYKWVPPLSAHFRVVRVDLRGLGMSTMPAESYENRWPDTLTLDAIALLDHLGVEKAVWVGEHTGALVGLMLSTWVPDRLHAVGVLGAPLRPLDMPAFQPDRIAPNKDVLGFRESPAYMRTRGMRAWLRAAARDGGRTSEFPPGYDRWYEDRMAGQDPLLIAKFRDGMIEVNMIPTMKEIAAPVLWLEGDRSPALTPAWREIVASHPKIKLVDIEGPGYALPYAVPEACIAEVKKFLQELRVWPE